MCRCPRPPRIRIRAPGLGMVPACRTYHAFKHFRILALKVAMRRSSFFLSIFMGEGDG